MATSGDRCLAREFISSIFVQDRLRMKNNPGWRSIPPDREVFLSSDESSCPRPINKQLGLQRRSLYRTPLFQRKYAALSRSAAEGRLKQMPKMSGIDAAQR